MNKHKEVITTAITNYDIDDIARAPGEGVTTTKGSGGIWIIS
ncbi:MAG: RNA methyltransferase [Selenomonas noxia]